MMDWSRDYKSVFMLRSAENEIISADKYEHARIVGIHIFISKKLFLFSYVLQERIYNS